MVAGDRYHLAHLLGIADEYGGPLELSGARPLRVVAGDGDDVEALGLNYFFNRFDLLGDGRPPEVQVGDVENRYSLAAHYGATRSARREAILAAMAGENSRS